MSRVTTSQPDPTNNTTTPQPQFAVSALDFLLIELVPLAQRVTDRLQAHEQELLKIYKRSPIFHPNGFSGEAEAAADKGRQDAGTEPPMTSLGFPATTADTREAIQWRIEALGYRVGQGLVERLSTNTPRSTTPLEAIKFICKDLWTAVWKKQIDNLKTNHRGIFVLTDARFAGLGRVSVDRRAGVGGAGAAGKERREGVEREVVDRARMYLYYPAGLIKGALMGLGIEATVEADVVEIPAAVFQIKIKGAKA